MEKKLVEQNIIIVLGGGGGVRSHTEAHVLVIYCRRRPEAELGIFVSRGLSPSLPLSPTTSRHPARRRHTRTRLDIVNRGRSPMHNRHLLFPLRRCRRRLLHLRLIMPLLGLHQRLLFRGYKRHPRALPRDGREADQKDIANPKHNLRHQPSPTTQRGVLVPAPVQRGTGVYNGYISHIHGKDIKGEDSTANTARVFPGLLVSSHQIVVGIRVMVKGRVRVRNAICPVATSRVRAAAAVVRIFVLAGTEPALAHYVCR